MYELWNYRQNDAMWYSSSQFVPVKTSARFVIVVLFWCHISETFESERVLLLLFFRCFSFSLIFEYFVFCFGITLITNNLAKNVFGVEWVENIEEILIFTRFFCVRFDEIHWKKKHKSTYSNFNSKTLFSLSKTYEFLKEHNTLNPSWNNIHECSMFNHFSPLLQMNENDSWIAIAVHDYIDVKYTHSMEKV